ncbi:ubiquitin protein ligase [Aureococcus anophagefferens]|nr:ubiquitin protein ligase [Aureococcus anophagefferens]
MVAMWWVPVMCSMLAGFVWPDGLPDGLPDALPGERADGLPREQPDGVPDGVPELVPHEDADALPDDGAARARAAGARRVGHRDRGAERRVAALVADDAIDFDAWDYEGGDRDSESKSQRTSSRAGVTSYVARRRGRIVTWEPLPDGSVSAKVVWAPTDRYAHALVRQLTLPAAESKRPPALGVRDGECLSLEAASRGFELPGGAALSPELRAAIERADMWPFRQRLQAVRDYLNAARVPYATGRVELKVKRGDCYGGCLKAFKKLAPKAWRMSWFLKSDAGNTTYDVAGCGPASGAARDALLLQYRFVGRCLAKCLFDGHTCLEASPNVKILKFLVGDCVGEPVVFDDLQLVDEALWMSLKKLRSIPEEDFDALALAFEVSRVHRSHSAPDEATVETAELDGGGDVAVTKANLERFFELRLRECVFEAHREELTAPRGLPRARAAATTLLLTARELELALCGTPSLDLSDWRRNTVYKGAFEAAKQDHPVCAAFWKVVDRWDDEQRARLLQWATGSSRLPVGGFRNLQQRDGVSRCFTLTSLPLATAAYPRSHTCFNRIDLPLYDRPAVDMPRALEFVITHATAEFTMD